MLMKKNIGLLLKTQKSLAQNQTAEHVLLCGQVLHSNGLGCQVLKYNEDV